MNDEPVDPVDEKIEASRQGERASLALEVPVEPQANKIEVLILQHPQEPDKVLGTAPLCVRALKNAKLKVGLSWPSLTKALGREAMPSRWGVLYLGGSAKAGKLEKEVNLLNKKMLPCTPQEMAALEGIVVIDGTWSQAKAMWWRNAWFLKLQRVVLQPKQKSRYGNLRKEPRRECLSTIESVALSLRYLDKDPAIADAMEKAFERMLEVYREKRKA